MQDYLTAFIGFFTSVENRLIILFLSAFLSATLLPGNSEIVFSTFVGQTLLINNADVSSELSYLLLSATVGNSLGSLTTYFLAYLLPPPIPHHFSIKSPKALFYSQKYGVIVLLLSWLPIVGDLLCGIAGWLRFPIWQVIICITLGKLCRYSVILAGIYIWLG